METAAVMKVVILMSAMSERNVREMVVFVRNIFSDLFYLWIFKLFFL